MVEINSIEPGIMISHTATESYLAQAWQDLIHEVFDYPRDKIWYSTDPDALDAGPFATQIEAQMNSSLAVISIQSSVSRFRPWTLWEAGIARGSNKPIFVVVYEKPGTERSMFSNLGTPLGALQHFRGIDIVKVKGVLDRLGEKLGISLVATRLESALANYKKIVESRQDCFSVRTEFWNRGLQKDSLRYAIESTDVPILDDILRRYYAAMHTIDPCDKGILPDPLPEFKVLQQAYSQLLKVNKDYYELVHRNFGRELKRLSDSIVIP
jgi:hypothetical protein